MSENTESKSVLDRVTDVAELAAKAAVVGFVGAVAGLCGWEFYERYLHPNR